MKLDHLFKVELNFQFNNRLITLIVFVKREYKKSVSPKKNSLLNYIFAKMNRKYSISRRKSIFIAIKYSNEMTTLVQKDKINFAYKYKKS